MDNPYIEYYERQAGSGISGYAGNRYHNGRGIFGKILKKIAPALKYIGRQGWNTLKNMSSDFISGQPLAEAGKNSLIRTTQNVLNDANQKIEEYKKKQTGNGVKRKRRSIAKSRKKPKKAKNVRKVKKVYKAKRRVKKTKKKSKKKTKIVSFF